MYFSFSKLLNKLWTLNIKQKDFPENKQNMQNRPLKQGKERYENNVVSSQLERRTICITKFLLVSFPACYSFILDGPPSFNIVIWHEITNLKK